MRRERRESEGLESAAGQAMGGHNGTCIVAGGPGERRGHWSGPHEAGSGCGARQLHPRHGFETVDADKPPPPPPPGGTLRRGCAPTAAAAP